VHQPLASYRPIPQQFRHSTIKPHHPPPHPPHPHLSSCIRRTSSGGHINQEDAHSVHPLLLISSSTLQHQEDTVHYQWSHTQRYVTMFNNGASPSCGTHPRIARPTSTIRLSINGRNYPPWPDTIEIIMAIKRNQCQVVSSVQCVFPVCTRKRLETADDYNVNQMTVTHRIQEPSALLQLQVRNINGSTVRENIKCDPCHSVRQDVPQRPLKVKQQVGS